jgi:hypothetical protein
MVTSDVREEGFDLICSSDIPTSSCSSGAEESVFKDTLKGVNFEMKVAERGKWSENCLGSSKADGIVDLDGRND